MATTAGAVPVLRHCAVLATSVLVFTLEIVRVTGRAIRSVLRPRIWNGSADCISVARIATRIPAMIARVVARRVAEVGWRPSIGGMTGVALRIRTQMSTRLGSRASTWRMTGVAVADRGGVVDPRAASERCGGMTGGTVQTGWNMRRYGIHHAYRCTAIVT